MLLIAPGEIEIEVDKFTEEHTFNLLWEDNFKGSSLDTNFWNIYVGNGCPELCGFGNNELQYYTSDSLNIKVKNGQLILTALYDSISKIFSSAKITTNNKIDFKNGYLEVVLNSKCCWYLACYLDVPTLNRKPTRH